MNCLQTLPRSSALPLQSLSSNFGKRWCPIALLGIVKGVALPRSCGVVAKAVSGSAASTENEHPKMDEKSETYSHDMTAAMGAVLTYRHELGMNYNFIQPDLIVGSCLQAPEDVDKLRSIGVKTIFCLQQDSDLEYFGVDIAAIREYANSCGDIQHLRAEISRAIHDSNDTIETSLFPVCLQSKRSCFPKLDAIKSATADILTGLKRLPVKLTWYGEDCSTVEISGLDIGWGQRISLAYDEEHGLWILHRELPEGRYEYKYIVDDKWTCNEYELVTSRNKDGHVNNYVEVLDDDPSSISASIRSRLACDEPELSTSERLIIRQFIETYSDED
ncbi:Phosphoglucan phosphatase DSP4- chloroplastic [Striga hermonthica]|uniref:Phosphoglucan phosphatase DSP4- chloroplastic n=1 Tax=Striga hermonthica TaxID=68872 RepID=A0A9N7MUC2_STRHE|nr:Phosphoglucan phosphatase DSP4- chloroplastic [Striga hermonthica]